jgi:HK97 gp10 family phage protein
MTEIPVSVNTEVLNRLIDENPKIVDKAIRSTAFDVERLSKRNAPWLTGALKNSIFTKTSQGSGFSQAASDASGKRPGVKLADPTPDCQLMEAYIAVGVNYGYFVEFGTGRMSARPFMRPAAEEAPKMFQEYMVQYYGEFK